jgi:hypothetical protein
MDPMGYQSLLEKSGKSPGLGNSQKSRQNIKEFLVLSTHPARKKKQI